MNNSELWLAVDNFVLEQGISCCGLARNCGLNTTVFNKSKRHSKYGQPRWISTKTLAKILNTYEISIHEFVDKYMPQHDFTQTE
ncbi:MAG: hypothetical protein NC311_02970 [Muribaculaceae bacterium]|nr:hypothetical protein [Muribaculaceae bacterium]